MGTCLFAWAVGLTSVLILVGTPQSFAGEGRLTGAHVTEHFSGARIYARTQFGEYLVDYKPNGEMMGADRNGADIGRWWVKENSLCRIWKRWNDGEVACFDIVIEGNTATWLKAGTKTVLDSTTAPKK